MRDYWHNDFPAQNEPSWDKSLEENAWVIQYVGCEEEEPDCAALLTALRGVSMSKARMALCAVGMNVTRDPSAMHLIAEDRLHVPRMMALVDDTNIVVQTHVPLRERIGNKLVDKALLLCVANAVNAEADLVRAHVADVRAFGDGTDGTIILNARYPRGIQPERGFEPESFREFLWCWEKDLRVAVRVIFQALNIGT